MNKLYSVHDHWTDINKKNDVDIESIDGVITGIKVNGEDYGGDETTYNTVFDGSVTTTLNEHGVAVGLLLDAPQLTADELKITFNGVEYTCTKNADNSYGAPLNYMETGRPDFSEYPFVIIEGTLVTQTAGTYSLKIEEPQSGGSSDFSTAKLTLEYIGQVAHAPLYISRIYDNIAITPLIPIAGTFDIVLYKGLAYGILETEDNVSVDGAIEYDDGDLIITGDCTITIS